MSERERESEVIEVDSEEIVFCHDKCLCMRVYVESRRVDTLTPHIQDSSDMYHTVCTQYLFTIVIVFE